MTTVERSDNLTPPAADVSSATALRAPLSPVVLLAFLLLSWIAVISAGGMLINLLADTWTASERASGALPNGMQCATVALLTGLAGLLSVVVLRRATRRNGMALVGAALGLLVAVGLGEVVLRLVTPGWPARALHGVSPEKWAAAILPGERLAMARLRLNQWGQRDTEHRLTAAAGERRIALIGDSFLEEGASSVLALELAGELTRTLAGELAGKLAGKLDHPPWSVINLGVSATGPDEYYERLRHVAVPLQCTHCCLFIFAGNDFVSPVRTLRTWYGIAAVEPRPALLTSLGLPAWNHALTNRYRPVLSAWMQGGQLALEEKQRALVLSQVDDQQMAQLLVDASGFSGAKRQQLQSRLQAATATPFFEILRHPDAGKFRSYYLTDALHAGGDRSYQWEPNSAQMAWEWTEQASQFCQRKQIGLTVILIPEAFQVDDRMRDQWLPVADLRHVTAPCRRAAMDFAARVRAAGIDFVDLHEHLHGQGGTYLNLDGHWSDEGVQRVAGILADHLHRVTVSPAASPEEK